MADGQVLGNQHKILENQATLLVGNLFLPKYRLGK
jgi:hypothetical protein